MKQIPLQFPPKQTKWECRRSGIEVSQICKLLFIQNYLGDGNMQDKHYSQISNYFHQTFIGTIEGSSKSFPWTL